MNPTALLILLIAVLSLKSFTVKSARLNRKLRITPKVCKSTITAEDITGICMFNLECQEKQGQVIGACVDRFLFGACCLLPKNSLFFQNQQIKPTETISTGEILPAPEALIIQQSTKSPYIVEKFVTFQNELPSSNFPTTAIPQKFSQQTSETTTVSNRESSGGGGGHINSENFSPFKSTTAYPGYNPVFTTFHKLYTTNSPSFNGLFHKNNNSDEKVSSLYNTNTPMSNGEYTTLSTTRDPVTLFPFALETFSSVSDPLIKRPSRNHSIISNSPSKFDNFMEPSTLVYDTLPTKNYYFNKKDSDEEDENESSEEDDEEESQKLSTFMWVDNSDNSAGSHSITNSINVNNKFNSNNKNRISNNNSYKDKIMEKTTPMPSFEEDLTSNTENVWSIVMQLAGEDETSQTTTMKTEMQNANSDELYNNLLMMNDRLNNSLIEQNINTNEQPNVEFESNDLIWKITTTSSSIVNSNSGEDSNEGQSTTVRVNSDSQNDKYYNRNKLTTLKPTDSSLFSEDITSSSLKFDHTKDTSYYTTEKMTTTTKPWASSTIYNIQTFQYPSFSEKDETTMSPLSFGKLTTWFGIDSTQKFDSTTTTTNPLSSSSITTESPIITTKSSTSTTTQKTIRSSIRPYTINKKTTKEPYKFTSKKPSYRPKPPKVNKPYLTEKTNIFTTTTPMTATTSKVYRHPPKRKTTPLPVLTTTIKHSKKPAKKPIVKKPIDPHSAILQDDLEENIDDFVNQVVQGLAGSLDNLDLDESMLSENEHLLSESGPSPSAPAPSESSFPPTFHPLHILSEPLFNPLEQELEEDTLLERPPGLFKPFNQVHLKKPLTTSTIPTTTTTTTTQKPLNYKKDCGVRPLEREGKIVGGTASKFGRWPWQALVRESTWLGLFSKNKCGGVLIGLKWILTAAHCQPGFLATLTVVLGDFDISSDTDTTSNLNAITKNVKRVIVHRDYNAQTFENDIALLELESPISEYEPHIVPVCMPFDREEFVGKKAYVTGWGRLKYGGGVPQQLHEVDVPILNNSECQQMFLRSGHMKAIRESFLCSGYVEGLKDSCEGDSGGPLSVKRETGQWVLAGTVSHGIKCAFPNLPGVYMRMTFYKPWIKRVTGLTF